MHDPVLLIGYMAAVGLTARFLVGPASGGPEGRGLGRLRWPALRAGVGSALMLPAPAVFGLPGLVALLLVALSPAIGAAAHGAWTARQKEGARDWTPLPAVWLVLELAVLACFVAAAWLALREAPLQGWFLDVTDPRPDLTDATIHWATLAGVGWALLVTNTVAAAVLVSLLLPPDGTDAGSGQGPGGRSGYTLRLGPLSGRIEPDSTASSHALDAVGATVGGLERLLVIVLILGRAEAGIGLVVAAKTLARFKQLDERHFAERYLIGTLASITIAVATALLARYALTGS
jgi:hypothetical protein